LFVISNGAQRSEQSISVKYLAYYVEKPPSAAKQRFYTSLFLISNTNSVCIVVQNNHAKPLWSKGAKNTIGLFYICKWYNSKYPHYL